MFKLYCFFNHSVAPTLVFSDEDLLKCVKYMNDKQFNPAVCMIVSPNQTRITFEEDDMIIHSNSNYRIPLCAC